MAGGPSHTPGAAAGKFTHSSSTGHGKRKKRRKGKRS